MQQFTAGGYQSAAIAGRIETLRRRIRTRLRILSGEELSHGHGRNRAGVADWEADQRNALGFLRAQLSHWEIIRAWKAVASPGTTTTAAVFDLVVPTDAMDDVSVR